jgi:phosphoribosylanthranilate isomerase
VLGTAGGGTGAVFDWSVAGKLNIPVILAGERVPHRATDLVCLTCCPVVLASMVHCSVVYRSTVLCSVV